MKYAFAMTSAGAFGLAAGQAAGGDAAVVGFVVTGVMCFCAFLDNVLKGRS